MELEIVLSFKGDVPIYEQIETQIRSQILSGALEEGSSIPSMRALARMLKVSVITVQKAYENLKKDGLIESAVGRGTVVAHVDRSAVLEVKRRELEEKIEEVIDLSNACSLSLDELLSLTRLLYEDEDHER